MMTILGVTLIGATAVMAASAILYIVLESLGYVRPGLKAPTLKIMKLQRDAPAYESHGTSLTFKSPVTVLLKQEGGRDVIKTGYFVAIPDGYCGVLCLRTESYKDAGGRPHTDIGTSAVFLPPNFEGQIEVEIWNKSFDEPAGMNAGLPLADLHLVPIPDTLRIVDKL